ncbi:DEAD/DEAH box helicase [Metasolibacillus meyeri]|uniref:DEAD/DEAH box helicase n=1 Tax=Metasolibacillus meyeri TaxID=1071052 RepID=A0AAW9NVR0_9BACL|nr:DEAD/DEAH box helicase [Metasolibacillus meyeri]MEC1178675.1 DEAD/DEAH box helicase [Metasolibacillus meyeri]
MEQLTKKMQTSLHNGFIDKSIPVSNQFKPKLLVNKRHENVLSTISQELKTCHTFIFSVAFITEGGLATLKSILQDIHKKGIKGRILTSTFLNFNQPKMFKELLKLENVEVRLSDIKGFHSKGYIFEHANYYSLIVGSSNLTDSALKTNFEWNIFLTSLENGEVIHHFKNQFEETWDAATPLSQEWIVQYEVLYKKELDSLNTKASNIMELESTYLTNSLREALAIQPNKMQSAALEQLKLLRQTGAQKGLIISATGTGKTYLSAFDVRNFAPKRMLFIVHREQILNKAMQDYKKILGNNDKDYGILSGNSKDIHAHYLFATVSTLSKEAYLNEFSPEHFDYILIDEVHRAGAESYLKILKHFNPKFLLGMTATPERTDNFNIYSLFDYNIAYEIRLQAALEEDMLCPFHYFGVTDYEHDGEIIDETTTLNQLVAPERVQHIIEKINYYGYSGEKLRGLIFCSSKEEARELSNFLNKEGLKTTALTGDNSQFEREEAIQLLEKGHLEYILTVDIFNEGIDIPFINQIIMLRQTQSSIIFIQQLGRGLRKHKDKYYLTIIDFIGNYKNNYLIPIALSGDHSMNKDNIRRKTVNTDYIQGVSTINFEEIAKKRIYEAINNTNLSTLKILHEAYNELKNRLNHTPMLYDFIEQNSLDPEVIIQYSRSYYNFLIKIKEEIQQLPEYANIILTMISTEFLNGKRIHELLLIKLLLQQDIVTKKEYIETLKHHGTYINNETIKSVESMLTLQFHTKNDKKKFGSKPLIIIQNETYSFNDEIRAFLQIDFFRILIEDLLKCAMYNNKKYNTEKPFTLYAKYSRRDVCRLLNWDTDSSSTIYGYRTKHDTTPLFVTYHKKDDIISSQAYGDEFLSPDVFKWYSRSRLNLNSSEVQVILSSNSTNAPIHLFIKKDDGEGSDFYYLGQLIVIEDSAQNGTMPDGKSVVTMNFLLEQPVQYDIYHYLVEE